MQRKVFRIEAMLGNPRVHQPATPKSPPLDTPDNTYAKHLEAVRDVILADSKRYLAANQ